MEFAPEIFGYMNMFSSKIEFIISFVLLSLYVFYTGCEREAPVTKPDDSFPPPPIIVEIGEWESVGLEGESVSAIAIDPNNPSIIFAGTMSDFSAGTRGKVFKSTDLGRTWTVLLSDVSPTAIVIDPKNPDIVYVGLAMVNFTPPGIVKSTNGGLSWARADSGIDLPPWTSVLCVAIDPRNPQILYVGTGGLGVGYPYKSTDAGSSWRIIDSGPPNIGNSIACLAIDPANTNIIYTGTVMSGDVLKSTNGGETWRFTGLANTGGIVYALQVNPFRTQTVYAGLWQIGFRLSENGGTTWRSPVTGLLDSTTTVGSIVVFSEEMLFASANWGDNGGVYCSTTGGLSWQYVGIDSSRVGGLAVDRLNKFLYVAKSGIHRTQIKIKIKT